MAEQTVMGEEKLSKRNLWSYSLGGIGRDMVYNLVNAQLFTCLLLTKNLSAANMIAISLIMIVCRIFDACNDPIMGGIIEITRTKWGKFKPWIMIGAITNVCVVFSMFFVPLKGDAYVIFFIFAYLLWGITYTMNDISYWGMLPSLTSNQKDRDTISTFATLFAGIGAGISVVLFPTLAYGSTAIGGSATTGSTVMCILFCCAFIGCQTMTCFVVKEKPLPPKNPNAEKPSLGKMFKVLFKNHQLLWASLAMLFYNVGGAILTSSILSIFIFLRFGYEGFLVTLFVIISSVSSGVMIFYPLLTRKFKRKQISTFSVILATCSYALMLIIGLCWQSNSMICFALLAASGFGAAIGQTMHYMVLTVSIENCVEYNEVMTGDRAEGSIFSLRPFMAKMGSAIVQGIVSLTFAALAITDITNKISNIENEATLGQISEEIKAANIKDILGQVASSTPNWLLVVLTVAPILFLVSSLAVYLTRYKITEDKYAELLKTIEERKAAGELPADDETETVMFDKEAAMEETIEAANEVDDEDLESPLDPE